MSDRQDSLTVLWTSGDKEVALNMLFMYVSTAEQSSWWNEIRLILWGPSQTLSVRDKEIREGLKELKEAGVNLEACVTCAKRYGVVSELEELGVDVYGMGKPLTNYLKGDTKVVTL